MKCPHRRSVDRASQSVIWIGRAEDASEIGREGGGERIIRLAHHLAADGNDRGEAAQMARHVPRPRPAHGDAGQIDALRIAVKLLDRLVQRSKGLPLHLPVPLLAVAALRKDDHALVAAPETLQRRSETDADLSNVVIAAFAAAVQEQNDRPAAQLRVVRRKPDSISIGVIAERDPALEEMRAAAAEEEKYCGESGGYSNRSYSAARSGS